MLAVSILLAYFAAIFYLFVFIWRKFPQHTKILAPKPAVFLLMAVVSFGHTWFYMLRFLHWSFVNYDQMAQGSESYLERISNWLTNTQLFEQAWRLVCRGNLNWWWSEQLCIFTAGSWTAFLYLRSGHYGISHAWAFMALGQIVAISVAMNLFYVHLSIMKEDVGKQVSREQQDRDTIPFRTWFSILLSLGTIALSPYLSDTSYFLPNLLVMHGLLFIPLLSTKREGRGTHKSVLSISSHHFLYIVAAISLVLRSRTSQVILNTSSQGGLGGVVGGLWDVLHSNPAQSSIGYDVVYSTISFFLWQVLQQPSSKLQKGAGLAGVVGFTGVVAPLLLDVGENGKEGSRYD